MIYIFNNSINIKAFSTQEIAECYAKMCYYRVKNKYIDIDIDKYINSTISGESIDNFKDPVVQYYLQIADCKEFEI